MTDTTFTEAQLKAAELAIINLRALKGGLPASELARAALLAAAKAGDGPERFGKPSKNDLVLVSRDLLGAACSAIDKKRDAPEILKQLREITFSPSPTAKAGETREPSEEAVKAAYASWASDPFGFGVLDDICTALRKAYAIDAAAPKAPIAEGWRTMESAPKDGTQVLIFDPKGHGILTAMYYAPYNLWQADPCEAEESEPERRFPTHWMPLPAPPTTGEQK